MKIIDTENNYLTIKVELTDWLYMKFDTVFQSGDDSSEFFVSGELNAEEIMIICDTFRHSVFTDIDNSTSSYSKDQFYSDLYIDINIDIKISHGNRISDFRNLKMAYSHQVYEKDRTLVTETMADIIVGKKDLIKAAYELECEMHNEINNYWKTKLLKV